MKNTRVNILKPLLMLVLMTLPVSLVGQDSPHFQGSFIIDRTVYDTETDVAQGQNTLRLDVNKDRMRLISDGDITISRLMARIQTRTIFLRHDKDDLLFVTRPTEAVQLTRGTLQQFSGMMQQFGAMMGTRAEPTEVIRTGEKEFIMGFLCEKVAVRRPERDEVTFVWLTDSLNINWGMIKDIPAEMNFSMSELFDQAWLSAGSFPLLAITFQGGKVRARAEVVDLVPDDPESANLDIERGVRTIGLTDYLFSNMWRR